MARTRSIKPSFFKNEYLAECDPMTRLLFVGLWTLADCNGRMECRPLRIKAELFPYENCDMEAMLSQLAARGFIQVYEAEGVRVLEITKFREHQRCHPDERAERLPAREDGQDASGEHSRTCENAGKNALPGNPAHEPGNPAREPGKLPANCALYPSSFSPSTSSPCSAPSRPAPRSGSKPADPLRWSAAGGWEGITDADRAEWSAAYPAADVPVELVQASLWLKANPKKARKSNWRAWLTTVWLSRCQDKGGTHKQPSVRPPGLDRPPPRVDPAFAAARKATEAREAARREAEHRRLDASAGDDDLEAARAAALRQLAGGAK